MRDLCQRAIFPFDCSSSGEVWTCATLEIQMKSFPFPMQPKQSPQAVECLERVESAAQAWSFLPHE